MSKSTSMGSHPLLNGRCQSLLQSTIMGSNPYNGCQSLLQSTRMGSNSLLMVDVKVYYSQREYIATFAESICIYKFNECIPGNVLIIWVLTKNLLVNAHECIFSWDFNMNSLFQQIPIRTKLSSYFQLAHIVIW